MEVNGNDEGRGRPRGLHRFGRGTALVVAGVVAGALVAGGVAIAAIPSTSGGKISACVKGTTGAVRVIDYQAGKRCVSGERLVEWSRLVSRGNYSATASYVAGDIVQANGSTYLAKLASKGRAVTSTTYWTVLAAKGATGATGPQGPPGAPADTSQYYSKSETDAKFASTVKINLPGGAFVPTGAAVVEELDGCYRNITDATPLQAPLYLPKNAVITKVAAYMVDTGADAPTVGLRKLVGGGTIVLATATGTSAGFLSEYSATLAQPETVNDGEYFNLAFTSPTLLSNYQICGASIEYTVPAGTSLQ